MAVGTIGLMAVCVAMIYALILPSDRFSKWMNSLVSNNALVLGLLISLVTLIGSQVYEHVIGYLPCLLCWYARIAFYPMVLMFALALIKKDRAIIDYAMGLTVFGLIITGYHSVITVVGESPIPCSADGVSCLTRYVYQFGFISIPLMVFVSFVFLFLVLLTAKRASK